MYIQGLESKKNILKQLRKPICKEPFVVKKGVSPDIVDTYEAKPSESRADLLSRIKKQVHAGFYNNESVVDDITHSLAKAFDSTL